MAAAAAAVTAAAAAVMRAGNYAPQLMVILSVRFHLEILLFFVGIA